MDPASSTYCQVIHRTFTNNPGDELHHSGWNTCSSCYELESNTKCIPKRDKLVLPCLNSDNIYIVDTGKDERKPELHTQISGDVLKENNVTAPHTTHCLPNGNIMISTMGDRDGNAKGDFIVFDSNYKCLGTWTKGDKIAAHGYDYWYQPFFDIMVASEWAAPKLFRRGFDPSDAIDRKNYGRSLNFYKWSEQRLIQTIDLGDEGVTPLEVRFLHNPKEPQGFVGSCLNSNIYHFWKKSGDTQEFEVKKVIDVPAKKIENWVLPELNGATSDIILSLDDKFLYFSNWFHGDIRQYDITTPSNPKLVGQIFLGGIVAANPKIKVTEDKELSEPTKPTYVKGKKIEGGPQMLQLSLDGKRLYVSSSLYSPWDKQFFPEMVKNGGTILQIDCDVENGGMTLNDQFLVDFGKEPNGPTLPHEMRYPGGDCTSDIWLVKE